MRITKGTRSKSAVGNNSRRIGMAAEERKLAKDFAEFKQLVNELHGVARTKKYQQVGDEYRELISGASKKKLSRYKLECIIVGNEYRRLLNEAGVDAILPSRPAGWRRIDVVQFDREAQYSFASDNGCIIGI